MSNKVSHEPKWTRDITQNWNDIPTVLTVEDTAILLKISQDTIKRYVKEGIIVGAKIGDLWRIDRDSLRKKIQCINPETKRIPNT